MRTNLQDMTVKQLLDYTRKLESANTALVGAVKAAVASGKLPAGAAGKADAALKRTMLYSDV